jgi:hypothetical protein
MVINYRQALFLTIILFNIAVKYCLHLSYNRPTYLLSILQPCFNCLIKIIFISLNYILACFAISRSFYLDCKDLKQVFLFLLLLLSKASSFPTISNYIYRRLKLLLPVVTKSVSLLPLHYICYHLFPTVTNTQYLNSEYL